MREVDRLARDAKLSNKQLAERLGVDSTMLIHLRTGRNLFSAYLLGRIAQVFPLPSIDELIVHHLRVERVARDASKLALPSDDVLLERLNPAARKVFRRFILHFARASVETGRGLYLSGSDTTALATGVQFLSGALQREGITVERIASNAVVSATQGRAALAAALLIVERVEFASAAVTDLLMRRSDVVKPIVVTSTCPVTEVRDTYLARIFTSMLQPVSLQPALAAESHAE